MSPRKIPAAPLQSARFVPASEQLDGGQERRRRMLGWLKIQRLPVRGGEMARRFGVSRQCLVQDIAILRAGGEQIVATPRGYFMPTAGAQAVRSVFACKHAPEQTEEELHVLVDCGVKVLDVIVEHPLYGELRGSLMLESRADVRDFLEQVRGTKATFLASLTGGVHLHTVEASKPEAIARAREALHERGFLAG